jgi:hypothetical protein
LQDEACQNRRALALLGFLWLAKIACNILILLMYVDHRHKAEDDAEWG